MKILIVSLILATGLWAHAHKHSSAKLEIVADKDVLKAKLVAPGMDLFGFEGEPKTKDHKEKLEQVSKLLKEEYIILTLEPEGHCSITNRTLETATQSKGHTDYAYQTTYKCKDVTSIKSIDVNLFRDIDSFKEVTVHVVSGKTQKEIKLKPTDSKFQL